MRGFPKYINTKEDVKNLLQPLKEHGKLKDYRKETKRFLKSLQKDRIKWFSTKVLAKGEAGIEDTTHKIITTEEKGVIKRIQYGSLITIWGTNDRSEAEK